MPIQIASWAASGISYATTGKSVSDHAVSAMAQQDCALHRVALGEDVCVPDTDSSDAILVAGLSDAAKAQENPPADRLRDTMISLAASLDSDLAPASGSDVGRDIPVEDEKAEETKPIDSVILALAETLNDIEPAAAPAADAADIPETLRSDGKHYLVIGNYRQLKDAEQARGRHKTLKTAVRMVLREGALLYMVTAGPFKRPDALEIGATLASKGNEPEIALLCADRASPPPCHDRDVPLQLTENVSR